MGLAKELAVKLVLPVADLVAWVVPIAVLAIASIAVLALAWVVVYFLVC